MNRILYILIGAGVMVALAVGFFEQAAFGGTTSAGVAATLLFCLIMAGGVAS